jgi:hypothetical protein
MALAINIPVQTARVNKESKLKVKVPSDGARPSYTFDPNDHIVDRQSQIQIELADPDPNNANGHDTSAKIEIYSYCTTELDLNKVRVSTVWEDINKPTSIAADPNSQAAAFPMRTKGIELLVKLDPRQMLFVGIIIKVMRSGKDDAFYLCDPQVGNGPTGTGNRATELFIQPPAQ